MKVAERLLGVAIIVTVATTVASAQQTQECTVPVDGNFNFRESTDIAVKVPGVGIVPFSVELRGWRLAL